MSAGFTIAWEFVVKAGRAEEFESHYGPDGSWAQLFRRAQGFLGVELLRDRGDARHYLTLDRWSDAASYRAFRVRLADEYAALDRACEDLTEREAPLGEYGSAGG